jgi:hypothetical protein
MIRFVALAAVVAFAATSANASEVRVSLVGKSADQIQADLLTASRTVCQRDVPTSPLIVGSYGRCVRETFKAAKAQLPA